MSVRIGIDLGGTKIEALALDRADREIFRKRVPTPRGDYQATISAVKGLVSEIGEGTVGVGIPGAESRGLIKNANSTWLIGRPLAKDLEAALGRPVRLENDANCFALSEAADGAGKGAAVVFGVILGTGVGGGFVMQRRVLQGVNGIAGEWGHNPLPWPTPDERPGASCFCGRSGCIETFVSGPGMLRDHREHGGTAASTHAIVAGSVADDPACEATMARYEERLARALAHVINIVDPDVVVLGGGMSNIERWYDTVPRIWTRWVFSDRVDTALVRHVHGDSSGVRGAAWLAGGHAFQPL